MGVSQTGILVKNRPLGSLDATIRGWIILVESSSQFSEVGKDLGDDKESAHPELCTQLWSESLPS